MSCPAALHFLLNLGRRKDDGAAELYRSFLAKFLPEGSFEASGPSSNCTLQVESAGEVDFRPILTAGWRRLQGWQLPVELSPNECKGHGQAGGHVQSQCRLRGRLLKERPCKPSLKTYVPSLRRRTWRVSRQLQIADLRPSQSVGHRGVQAQGHLSGASERHEGEATQSLEEGSLQHTFARGAPQPRKRTMG